MKLGKEARDAIERKIRDVSLIVADKECGSLYIPVWELMYGLDLIAFGDDLTCELSDHVIDEKVWLMEVVEPYTFVYVPEFRKNELRFMTPECRHNDLVNRFDHDITWISLRGSHLLVLLSNNNIHIYTPVTTADALTWKEAVRVTEVNSVTPNLLAISAANDVTFAAVGAEANAVEIYKPYEGPAATTTFQAHKSKLTCVAINNEGTLVATASESGRMVRVWWCGSSGDEAEQIYEFRRSWLAGASITSLVFTDDSSCLASFGDGTDIHVHQLHPGGFDVVTKELLQSAAAAASRPFFRSPALAKIEVPRGVGGVKCHQFRYHEYLGLDLIISGRDMVLRTFHLSPEGVMAGEHEIEVKDLVAESTMDQALGEPTTTSSPRPGSSGSWEDIDDQRSGSDDDSVKDDIGCNSDGLDDTEE